MRAERYHNKDLADAGTRERAVNDRIGIEPDAAA
jgi:hypothetical protein